MVGGMEQLYSEVILDHSRNPHGRGEVPAGVAQSHQMNPICGDEVTLGVRLGQGGTVIEDISWQGQGCSISLASTSVLTQELTGSTVDAARTAQKRFVELMHSRGAELDFSAAEELGDAAAFSGTAKFPARIKCALLGWMALLDAVNMAVEASESDTRAQSAQQ